MKLSSLGEIDGMLITLAGEYALEGSGALRFDRGVQIALAASEGNVYLSAGGVTLNLGPEFTLTRCAAVEGLENGMYIHGSERQNLYEGDLRVICEGNVLTPVLHIAMEDYLCGVVAYEMSDSFPIEALKAQAVAARTYAMRCNVDRSGKYYDVTDTTTDQVFKGFDGSYENVIRAVRETAGVVGVYNGSYATCYYTASNGGQVATPNQIWGGDGDYGYIQQKDDPYDLENPKSLVNSHVVPTQYEPENAMWQLIMAKMPEFPLAAEVRVDGITGMWLDKPRFEGSYMYENANVAVDVDIRRYTLIPCPDGAGDMYINGIWYVWGMSNWRDTVDVVLNFSVYDELKDELGLGLNSRDYDVPSIEFDGTNYVISMRRYGHGVGMSQRGAQTMAGAHGKSFTEILDFYYPGMVLERIYWLTPALTELTALPEALIAQRLLIVPAEGELGELNEGEYFARVALEGNSSRLNVRAEPTTEAGIVAKLSQGYRLIVVGEVGDGWAQVRTGRFTGYVKLDYIRAE